MEEYRKALSELNVIINNLPEELDIKIPNKFKQMVEQEKDNEYEPDVNNLVMENNMLPETIVILGLIYRDFLCDESEREKLQLIEKEELALVEVKKKWYTKILDYFERKIKSKD